MKKKLRYILVPILILVVVLPIALTLPQKEVEVAEGAVVLKKGSQGSSVKTLQTKLKKWGY